MGTAADLPARTAARMAVRLDELRITTWEYRAFYRYWRLRRAAENALLLVVAGPPRPVATAPPA